MNEEYLFFKEQQEEVVRNMTEEQKREMSSRMEDWIVSLKKEMQLKMEEEGECDFCHEARIGRACYYCGKEH